MGALYVGFYLVLRPLESCSDLLAKSEFDQYSATLANKSHLVNKTRHSLKVQSHDPKISP